VSGHFGSDAQVSGPNCLGSKVSVHTNLQLLYFTGGVGTKNVVTESLAVTAASSSLVDDELDVTTIERRRRWSNAKYTNSATLPRMYTRCWTACFMCICGLSCT